MASIFSKIIAGDIPAYTLYEDAYVYAFLDIFPQQSGHTLIVPKIEIDHFSDVPEPYYTAIFDAAKRIAPALQKATGCQRVCASFVGYEISHCHYHLIPTNTVEQANFSPRSEASPESLKKMQQAITSFLS